MDKENTVCFSGHRTSRLNKYAENIPWLRRALSIVIRRAVEERSYRTFISGGALGVDQWAALEVIKLKEEHPDVKLIIARPFPSQNALWTNEQKKEYQYILDHADEVVDVSPDPYAPQKMFVRNQWMVEHSNVMIAVWDGSSSGGTKQALSLAFSPRYDIEVFRINPKTKKSEWVKYRSY